MSALFGIVRGETIQSYHANPAISSTQLLDMRPTPQFFYQKHVAKTLPREERKEFDLGNGAHWLILEGRAALEERTVLQPLTYPVLNKLGDETDRKPWTYAANYCKDWRAAQAGKVILSAEDFATIDRMAAAVGENPDAVALLSGGESEVTFRVQHPAFAVQARADHWHEKGVTLSTGFESRRVIADLKTCETIERFKRDFFIHRYLARAAFYQEVERDAVGSTDLARFAWVALEKSAPFRCEVFEAEDADMELGRAEALSLLMELRKCIQTNEWPNSKPGIQRLELSGWQRKLSSEASAELFGEAA